VDRGDNRYNPLMITALNTPFAGLTLAPNAQSRIEIWPGALTHIVPTSPASIPLGHPGATASPAAAPGMESVKSAEQVFAAIRGKFSVTEFRKYVGTTVPSTAMVVCPPASTETIPVPP
jgi:tRNA A37 threonylcarbamoyladenosine synthetase subunit TsaC/SUA5/YrdC